MAGASVARWESAWSFWALAWPPLKYISLLLVVISGVALPKLPVSLLAGNYVIGVPLHPLLLQYLRQLSLTL